VTAPASLDTVISAQPTSPATPSFQATPAAAAPTRYGVSLQHAVESVRATIELGARQGASHARIELSPPSLGTIRIQLQHTDDGLTARVITDHAATADTLSQGGDDLRRALQSAGVNLLSLNIETRGGSSGQTQDPAQNGAPRYTSEGTPVEAVDESEPAAQTTLALPDGALVNVLA
jgi:flagellar hook-length control protein FliK